MFSTSFQRLVPGLKPAPDVPKPTPASPAAAPMPDAPKPVLDAPKPVPENLAPKPVPESLAPAAVPDLPKPRLFRKPSFVPKLPKLLPDMPKLGPVSRPNFVPKLPKIPDLPKFDLAGGPKLAPYIPNLVLEGQGKVVDLIDSIAKPFGLNFNIFDIRNLESHFSRLILGARSCRNHRLPAAVASLPPLALLTKICESQVKRLLQYESELEGLVSELSTSALKQTSQTPDKIKHAMEKIHELAVFIRGDYDARLDEEKIISRQKQLIKDTLTVFELLQKEVEGAFDNMSELHIQVWLYTSPHNGKSCR